VKYVGRSDEDVRAAILLLVGDFTHFKMSYAASAAEAFRKECENYHDFNPTSNDSHPAPAPGDKAKCPRCDELD
jgi:hypothetical protein